MNVKKIQLRNDIITYLNEFPASEVKEIASHVGVSKQALYYHIKLLLKDEKIEVVDRKIVNGIEKRFYSTIVTVDSTHNDNDREESKQNIKVDPIEDTAVAEEEMIDQNIIEKTSISSPIKVDSLDKPNEDRENSTISDDIPLELEDQSTTTQTNEDNLPTSIDLKKQKSSSFLGKLKNVLKKPIGKSTKQKKGKINKEDKEPTKSSFRESFHTIVENFKSLGVLNIDSYDTMGSMTALVTTEGKVITFNNRQRSKFNVDISPIDSELNNKIKRNLRLVVVDENLIDNHEIITTKLKKKKDQERFIKRYINKKYNINENDLVYTFEKFNTANKDTYELNTLFSKRQYLENSNQVFENVSSKDRIYISIAGIFAHFNDQISKRNRNDINLYIYMGQKGCELTWVKGRQILHNRTVLVSNQILPEKSYIRETIPRIVRSIGVTLNQLQEEKIINEQINPSFYLTGPNCSDSIKDYFKEAYQIEVKYINVKISETTTNDSREGDNSRYNKTCQILSQSLKKWGGYSYVYDQETKNNLRKIGILNLANLSVMIVTMVLIMFNIKIFESFLISGHNRKLANSNYEMTEKLIKNAEQSIIEQTSLNNLNQLLYNIRVSKQNKKVLFKLLNSEAFRSVNIISLQMTASSPEEFDQKKYTVSISGELVDLRPEAILESENISSTLKTLEYLIDSNVTTSRYQKDRLPISINFTL
ncbi:MAG: winged helix-turn-helix domain-containing protein [Candidatus Marinimicrobia bacterium]|jgi:DNA-binding transcriptional ArsR family regulator|nr:winged helix-turn-helix domain-containing protein [Candidatus Neomarinimicrobiota bacterium]